MRAFRKMVCVTSKQKRGAVDPERLAVFAEPRADISRAKDGKKKKKERPDMRAEQMHSINYNGGRFQVLEQIDPSLVVFGPAGHRQSGPRYV